eukprot:4068171-Pleurochrysis_carterae.AAC.2
MPWIAQCNAHDVVVRMQRQLEAEPGCIARADDAHFYEAFACFTHLRYVEHHLCAVMSRSFTSYEVAPPRLDLHIVIMYEQIFSYETRFQSVSGYSRYPNFIIEHLNRIFQSAIHHRRLCRDVDGSSRVDVDICITYPEKEEYSTLMRYVLM